MYYAAVSILSVLVLIIINQDVLFRHDAALKMPALAAYKKFIVSVLAYCFTDILWGILQDLNLPRLLYIDTALNYVLMAVAIWFWIGYIVTYYNGKEILKTVFRNLGRAAVVISIGLVIYNAYNPILFEITEKGMYVSASNKFGIQICRTIVLLFLLLHSLCVVFLRYKRKRQRAGVLALFVLIMAAFIAAQLLFYDLPFYSLAYLLGSCLLHFFVIEDEKERFMRETHEAAQREILSASATYENIIRMLSKDYFDLFYVDLETDEYIEYGSRTELDNLFSQTRGTDFFKTINKNVNKIVYEEDRPKLIEVLNKENILSEIEKKGLFGVYYRLVIEGKPTYVGLKATRVLGDEEHLIIGITNVDAQMKDRIYAESLKEEQKAFTRMNAFSRNLLVFYVIDPETDEYDEFSATEDYEKLGISKKGNNFFEEVHKNSLKIIFEEDREMFNRLFTRRNILGAVEIDGIFIMEYRLLIGNKPTYVRLKASEIEENGKKLLIIGVEDVDLYIRREQRQANELSAAKELAVKDALTGVRNNYAFSQAKKSLNEQIDNLEVEEFAIVICDINGLKEVNDNKGHLAGDDLIRRACERICNTFKHSSVFRIGGDEFAVICKGQDYKNINILLERMSIANTSQKDVQIAFGMARFCIGQSVEEVIHGADTLMYEHKAAMKARKDINSGVEDAEELYQFPENLKSAYESSPLSFVYYQNINNRAVPVLVSDGFCRNAGMPRETVVDWLSNGMFERMHPDDVGVMAQISDDFLNQRGEYDTIFRCRLARLSNDSSDSKTLKEEYMYIHGVGKWQTMPDGTQLAVITYGNLSMSQEATDEKRASYTTIRHDSYYTDTLTKLPNINYLNDFGVDKADVIRADGRTPNVIFLDIYSMQSYNNQYGFKEGDRLLCLTAKTLSKQFAKSLVIRESGDHFIILSPVDSPERIEKLISKVNRSIRMKAHGNTSGIRCGVCPMDETTALNEAIDHAKMALKHIENNMNREVEFFSKSSNMLYLQDRYIIENLDRAIREGWIRLYYHAIYRAETQKIAAFECLARWHDPVRGVIYPGVFISVLQKYHQLHKLDLFMFEQACREVKYRYENNLPLVPVSVNFSRQDFDHVDVLAEMNRLYDKYGMADYVDKSYFIIEITEQDLEEGEEVFQEQLSKILENKYRLWLDDFGSGYSAINSFSKYEFDLIKFDMNLVKNLDDVRGVNHILLEDMVNLARKLGIHTLIEGAETQEHIDFIKQIGCELIQGFYYSKPEPLDQILERVKRTGFIKMCETPEEREEFNEKWFE